MRREIEFLQGAFESYKTQVHLETDTKWRKREADLNQKFEEELEERMQELSECDYFTYKR